MELAGVRARVIIWSGIQITWARGGAVMEVQEILYGRPHRLWMALTKAGPGGWIGYRVLPGLSGECGVSSVSCGSGFTAVIDIGVRVPIIGPIVCWLLRRAVGARVDAIGHHPKGAPN